MLRLDHAIIGILIFAAFTVALAIMISEGMIHRTPKATPASPAGMNLPPSPMEPTALAALEAFFEAPDLSSKATRVRDSIRVRPMMDDFHDQRGHPFPTLGRVSPGHVTSFNGTPMVLFEVEPFSGPRYPVAVVWDGHCFAVDWESLTAYGTMDWSVFLESKTSTPQTMRLFIMAAGESARPPGATETQAFFRIEHRDDPQPIIASADADVAAGLSPLIGNRRVPVILEIAWKTQSPGGIPSPHILRLVAEKWSQ